MNAERLLRLYPRAWRERYGPEFVEMIGPEPLRSKQVIDITMGAIDAWFSSEVRQSAGSDSVTQANGGQAMLAMLKTKCATPTYKMTTRDGLISAAVILLTTLVMVSAGTIAKRNGYSDLSEVLLSMAFPVSMLVMLPFSYMKGQPWRAQALLLGISGAILTAIGIMSVRI